MPWIRKTLGGADKARWSRLELFGFCDVVATRQNICGRLADDAVGILGEVPPTEDDFASGDSRGMGLMGAGDRTERVRMRYYNLRISCLTILPGLNLSRLRGTMPSAG